MVNLQASLITADARPDASRAVWLSALAKLALLFICMFALFHDAAGSMASIWLTSSVYHHGLIVAPVTALLIWRRKDWRVAAPQGDNLGALVIAAAAVIWLVGRASSLAVLGHFAVALSIVGAVIAVFGRALARRWAFALGFLFFMVPFGAEATPILQHWAAIAVAGALNLSGIETARDGFMLTTSVGRFEMAEACAGLRFLLAAAMIASLVASMAFSGWKKRCAFIAASLAAAILANWIRAYLIILAATLTDRRLGVGPEHVTLGWVFYSALILGLIALARRIGDAPNGSAAAPINIMRHGGRHAVILALASCALIAAYDRLVVSAPGDLPAPVALPTLQSADFAVTDNRFAWSAYAPHADSTSIRRYRSASGEVSVSAAYTVYDRAGAEIASAEIRAADGVIWRRLAITNEEVLLGGANRRVRIEMLENDFGEKLDVAALYWLDDQFYSSSLRLKATVALNKLAGRRLPGGSFFVAADAGSSALIRDFLAGAEPVAAWRTRIGGGD